MSGTPVTSSAAAPTVSRGVEFLLPLIAGFLGLNTHCRKQEGVEPTEIAIYTEFANDLFDARDGSFLALLEEPRHLLAAQIDQRAQPIVANRREMRCRSRRHAAANRPAIDDDDLVPNAGQLIGNGEPCYSGSDDDGVATLLARETRSVWDRPRPSSRETGVFAVRVHAVTLGALSISRQPSD